MEYNIKLIFDKELDLEIDNFLKYLKDSGYYSSTVKNKNRLDDISFDNIADSGLVLKTIPYRTKLNLPKNNNISKLTSKRCALCEAIQGKNKPYPLNLAKGLLWRGYIIRPNDFPYMNDHLLILSSDHNHGYDKNIGSQDIVTENNKVLMDMIDFYKLLNYKGTMFFNGLAGNSQLHFHFHYTTETLPIQKYLYNYNMEEKKDNLNQFVTKNGTNLFLFNSREYYCFNGIFLYGKLKGLKDDVFKLASKIKSKKKEYNIVFLPKNNNDFSEGNLSVVLYMRDVKSLKKTDPNLGASIVSGHYTDPSLNKKNLLKKEVNKEKIEKFIRRVCSITVVKPNMDIINSVLK